MTDFSPPTYRWWSWQISAMPSQLLLGRAKYRAACIVNNQDVSCLEWGWWTWMFKEVFIFKSYLLMIKMFSDCGSVYGEDRVSASMVCAGWPEGGRDSCQVFRCILPSFIFPYFIQFHPLTSNPPIFIHFHPLSPTFIHFHPLSSTLIHFHPLSSTFTHLNPLSYR